MQRMIPEYSTYARSILSDLQTLAKMIRRYSFQEKPHKGQLGLLAQTQIEQALLNPQNSLQLAMSAAAGILKMKHEIRTAREQAEAQRRLIRESIEKIESRETKPLQKDQIEQSLNSLRSLQKKITTHLQELTKLEAQLTPLLDNIDQVTLQCNEEWEVYRSYYLNKLLTGLESQISLTEEEKKELLSQETWNTILHRFQVLNIEMPSYLNIEEPNYSSYFRLKGYLAVHDALGRQMQPNKPEDIVKILKPLLKN